MPTKAQIIDIHPLDTPFRMKRGPKPRLLPARHVRKVIPRVCATCEFGKFVQNIYLCNRDKGINTQEIEQRWLTTCDQYRLGPKYAPHDPTT